MVVFLRLLAIKGGNIMIDSNITITINGKDYTANEGATILEVINQNEIAHPQICYVPEVDPIQTCDTCIVEVNGKLVRSCSTKAVSGMDIALDSSKAKEAQTEAMDRILENHSLYCTVCDNNNGNCKLHNTAELMEIEHQNILIHRKWNWVPSICPIHFTAMMPINASHAGNVLKYAKTFRSTRRCPSTGKQNALG